MKKLSKTETELKKSVASKKSLEQMITAMMKRGNFRRSLQTAYSYKKKVTLGYKRRLMTFDRTLQLQ